MSDSHSGHILVLFCGAEEERIAEMLACGLDFKKAKSPNWAKVWNECHFLMQMQDIHSNRGT